MADIGVKMGVSGLAQFKQAMTQAQASVKTYDAQMKLAEKQLKATGDAEQYMQTKTTALKGKLDEQQKVVKSAEQALKSMKNSGVDPASAAFQNMEQKLLKAQTAVLDTQMDIQELGTESLDAADKTDQLANSLGGLNRKVSLEQVISGIGKITGGMEAATKKAIELGKAIWENIVDTARYSDDIATQALQTGLSVEDFQRYKGVFDTVGEITVQEWMKAKQKVQQAIHSPSGDQETILSLLGISTHEMVPGKFGIIQGAARGFEEVFWEIGETLKAKVESGELTPDLADTYAQAIFGKGFASLKGLFDLGPEGFAAALDQQTVASEDAVNANAELNDKLIQLEASFNALKMEVIGGLAPALTMAADSINGLLQRIMEWLKTPEGQQALEDLGKAVEGLFSDLGKIDPEEVAQSFATVFGGIVDSVKWLSENWESVRNAIVGIGEAFIGLKVGEGVLTVIKLIDGLKGLTGREGKKLAQAVSDAAGAGGGINADARKAAKEAAKKATEEGRDSGILKKLGRFIKDIGETALFALPAALAIDQQLRWQGLQEQGKQQVEEDRQHIAEVAKEMESAMLDDAFRQTWEGITAHAMGNNTVDAEVLQDWAARYQEWISTLGDDPIMETLVEALNEDTFTELENLFNNIADGLPLDPLQVAQLMEKVQGELEEYGKTLTAPTEPELPENAEQLLQQQLNGMDLNVMIHPYLGQFGFNLPDLPGKANGMPYVPFDGYMAVLHKGERVVPAREAEGNRSFTSNLYVESMYMNNGTDAEGLAASIAAANRRTMAGFGS